MNQSSLPPVSLVRHWVICRVERAVVDGHAAFQLRTLEDEGREPLTLRPWAEFDSNGDVFAIVPFGRSSGGRDSLDGFKVARFPVGGAVDATTGQERRRALRKVARAAGCLARVGGYVRWIRDASQIAARGLMGSVAEKHPDALDLVALSLGVNGNRLQRQTKPVRVRVPWEDPAMLRAGVRRNVWHDGRVVPGPDDPQETWVVDASTVIEVIDEPREDGGVDRRVGRVYFAGARGSDAAAVAATILWGVADQGLGLLRGLVDPTAPEDTTPRVVLGLPSYLRFWGEDLVDGVAGLRRQIAPEERKRTSAAALAANVRVVFEDAEDAEPALAAQLLANPQTAARARAAQLLEDRREAARVQEELAAELQNAEEAAEAAARREAQDAERQRAREIAAAEQQRRREEAQERAAEKLARKERRRAERRAAEEAAALQRLADEKAAEEAAAEEARREAARIEAERVAAEEAKKRAFEQRLAEQKAAEEAAAEKRLARRQERERRLAAAGVEVLDAESALTVADALASVREQIRSELHARESELDCAAAEAASAEEHAASCRAWYHSASLAELPAAGAAAKKAREAAALASAALRAAERRYEAAVSSLAQAEKDSAEAMERYLALLNLSEMEVATT